MRQAADLAAEADCRLLIVLQPSLAEKAHRTEMEETILRESLRPHASGQALNAAYERMRRELTELAAHDHVAFLDASRLFDDQTATTFTDMWHFSDVGHQKLGQAIARGIQPLLNPPPE
jgi:hypothetical protein